MENNKQVNTGKEVSVLFDVQNLRLLSLSNAQNLCCAENDYIMCKVKKNMILV
jgi:hypothetical protein